MTGGVVCFLPPFFFVMLGLLCEEKSKSVLLGGCIVMRTFLQSKIKDIMKKKKTKFIDTMTNNNNTTRRRRVVE